MDYRPIEREVVVPKGTGHAGFLRVLEGILKRPRVQEVHILANGVVKFRQFVPSTLPDTEIEEFQVDLETLRPYAVLRSCEIREMTTFSEDMPAPVVVSKLFAAAAQDALFPVAFISGSDSTFWEWHGRTSGVVFGKESAYGQAVLPDPDVPNDAFFLCAAYGKEARLIDTKVAYKITVPTRRTK
jgi:hypothetical protein